MDLRNTNHTPFTLQEKHCVVLSPTVSKVLSPTLETKSSAATIYLGFNDKALCFMFRNFIRWWSNNDESF